jgi:hypothetical protein
MVAVRVVRGFMLRSFRNRVMKPWHQRRLRRT